MAHSRRATRALRKLAEDDPALAALALWCRHRDSDRPPAPAAWALHLLSAAPEGPRRSERPNGPVDLARGAPPPAPSAEPGPSPGAKGAWSRQTAPPPGEASGARAQGRAQEGLAQGPAGEGRAPGGARSWAVSSGQVPAAARVQEVSGQGASHAAAAPDAWTDGTTIFYGPGFEMLALREQVGLAAHQVLHVALRHAARGTALWRRFGARFDARLYNIATDALINQTLVEAGHALPRPAVLLPGLLRAGLGRAAVPPDEAALGRWDAERLYLRLAGEALPSAGGGRSRSGRGQGGGAGGDSPAERARRHAAGEGFREDLLPQRARSDEAAESRAASEWRAHVIRALAAGRQAGRGIGAAGHVLADLPLSRTPWETLMRGLAARALTGAARPDWGRPSRRFIAAGADAMARGLAEPAFEPALRRDGTIPRVVVALDCSSSIDDRRLAVFAAQVVAIARRGGADLHLLTFDTVVQAHLRLRGADAVQRIRSMALPRGGGTSFVPVMEAAAALNPSLVVVLTDLDGPHGPRPAGARVIWAVPEGPEPGAVPPPYGHVLDLSV